MTFRFEKNKRQFTGKKKNKQPMPITLSNIKIKILLPHIQFRKVFIENVY